MSGKWLKAIKSVFNALPKRIKKGECIKSDKPVNKKLIAGMGAGILGVLAGIGIFTAIRRRKIKKVILLVGAEKKTDLRYLSSHFNGYLLKYTGIDNFSNMVDMLYDDAFKELVIIPMLLINGYEVEYIKNVMINKRKLFKKVKIAPALLTSDVDYTHTARVIRDATMSTDCDTAVLCLGNGTTHYSNASYIALSERLKKVGAHNVFVATVSAYPDFEKVKAEIEALHYQKIVILPLEMSINKKLYDAISVDNENSWCNRFRNDGYICESYGKGLCAFKGIRRLVVEHTKSTIDEK